MGRTLGSHRTHRPVFRLGDPATDFLPKSQTQSQAQNQGMDIDFLSQGSDLKSRCRFLFNQNFESDVVFVVGKIKSPVRMRIPAHKFIIRLGSPVLFNSLSGNWSENDEQIITDFDASPFLTLLRFLYMDEIVFELNHLYDVLAISAKYMVDGIRGPLTTGNEFRLLAQEKVWSLLMFAIYHSDRDLIKKCWKYIDENCEIVVTQDDFYDLDHNMMSEFLSRDTLKADEIALFNACVKWSTKELTRMAVTYHQQEPEMTSVSPSLPSSSSSPSPSLPTGSPKKMVKQQQLTNSNRRSVMQSFIHRIRFPLMDASTFASGPGESGILSDREVAQVLKAIVTDRRDGTQFDHKPRACKTDQKLVNWSHFICTYILCGKNSLPSQHFYRCNTCNFADVCVTCVHKCHQGHQVKYVGSFKGRFCDCGYSKACVDQQDVRERGDPLSSSLVGKRKRFCATRSSGSSGHRNVTHHDDSHDDEEDYNSNSQSRKKRSLHPLAAAADSWDDDDDSSSTIIDDVYHDGSDDDERHFSSNDDQDDDADYAEVEINI